MIDPAKLWNGDGVRKWLTRRMAGSRLDQAAADRRGYEAQDDYDKAAAEEWVCSTLLATPSTDDQAAFAKSIKELIARDDYTVTGIYDDVRFERHVRGHLRKLAKMTKANEGFEKMHHYQ